MTAGAKRYCTYCKSQKPVKGFKEIRDRRGLLRNRKCGDCCAMKHKTVAQRDAQAQRQRDDRKAAAARRMQDTIKEREVKYAQKAGY